MNTSTVDTCIEIFDWDDNQVTVWKTKDGYGDCWIWHSISYLTGDELCSKTTFTEKVYAVENAKIKINLSQITERYDSRQWGRQTYGLYL
jgi:hypothetical protein